MADSNPNNNPLVELYSSIKDYLDLRIDEIKLALTENMAKIFSKIIYFILAAITGGIAVGFLAIAFSSWMGTLLGSPTLGYLITAGVLLLILFVLYLNRNRLFMNSAIKLFIRIFFDEKEDGKGN